MLARLLALACLAVCAEGRAGDEARAPVPNVLLIVTDDQGYGDFSHAGHGVLETPHLDRLAADSPRVERFYVSAVCSPTRASLMTGRWNYRTRVLDTWIGRSMMDPGEVTLAEVFSGAGYATGIFGKWHLGDCFPMRPGDQGFDRSLVHRGGGLAQPSEPPENGRRYSNPILFADGEPIRAEGYCTDVYFDAARAFIDECDDAGRPFFAYVATNAPHDPFHDVPPGLLAKYAGRDLAPSLRGKSEQVDREARICAMVENIDSNVGSLLAHLAARELEGETIVVFLCDNGPVQGRTTAGLRGHKAQPYEGGIRSRLFVRWEGWLSPEARVARITAHVDLFPTLLELAGVPGPEGLVLDGRSFAPLLRGEETEWPERYLFFQSHRGNAPVREHHFAVVGERWKLVRASGFARSAPQPDHPFELFDLAADPGETTDVASSQGEIVARMRAAYGAWFDDVSATRPDNWAPPRIVLDAAAEPRTTLTRQDLRFPRGEGWQGEDGAWHLASPEGVERDVVLLFAEAQRVDRVRVSVAGESATFEPDASGTRIEVGRIRCPPGAFELSVEVSRASEGVPVHQVELIAPR